MDDLYANFKSYKYYVALYAFQVFIKLHSIEVKKGFNINKNNNKHMYLSSALHWLVKIFGTQYFCNQMLILYNYKKLIILIKYGWFIIQLFDQLPCMLYFTCLFIYIFDLF